jgi:hypothetical protein
MRGLDPRIHRKKAILSKRMDCRVISAFTRVFNALCPAMTNAASSFETAAFAASSELVNLSAKPERLLIADEGAA